MDSWRSWRRYAPGRWTLASLVAAAVLMAPIAAVVGMALVPAQSVWPHLWQTSLPGYLRNTALLMVLVAAGTAVVGAGTAWLVTSFRFPGRNFLEWALLAPFAVPAYIAAYTLIDMMEYAGPVQFTLREAFGWQSPRDYWFPEFRSLTGAAVVMTFAFYPYVYLLARAALRAQSATAVEVARSLGRGFWGATLAVVLPLARPAVAAGVALALMETLNDFGTVDYLAVQTLTVGVISIWFEARDPGSAAQIALVPLVLVVLLVAVERQARRNARFHDPSARFRPHRGRPLPPLAGLAATTACLVPIAAGFLFPVAVLLWYAVRSPAQFLDAAFLDAALHTASLAVAAASLAVAAAVLMVFGARTAAVPALQSLIRVASLGYAIPGVVLAIGILIPLLAADHLLADLGLTRELILGGSVAGLIFAYVVRFMAIPHGAAEAGFSQVTPSMEMVARTLGETPGGTLRRVQLPLLHGTLVAAWVLVFVDVAKELPATLILRPFNYETLATHVYLQATLERLENAAPAALAIIVIGLAPAAVARMLLRPADWTRADAPAADGRTG